MIEQPSYEGILVLGLPRSGTTLVRRLLDSHPEITCPGETNLFRSCARFLHSESFAEGVPVGVLTGLTFMGYDETEVLRQLREFAFHFHRENVRKAGKRLWADKSPLDVFYLDAVEKLVSNHVRYICLHRHALDVACSLLEFCTKSGGYLSEIHQYIIRYPQPLVAFAQMWVEVTQRLIDFAARHPTDAIVLKYEDLVANPVSQMKRVIEFLDAQWDSDLVNRAMLETGQLGMGDWKTYAKTAIDKKSVGRWAELSQSTINSLANIVNPTLIAAGYSPLSHRDDGSDEETRRKYLLGLMVQKMRANNESN